jgi:valyl-tRNA synthetase
MKLDPKKKVPAEFASTNGKTRGVIEANREAIQRLGLLTELRVHEGKLGDGGGGMRSTAEFDLRIPYVEETVDVAAELGRLKKEIEGLEKAIASKEKQLGNETFRSRAPEKIIREMGETLAGQKVELGKMIARKRQLEEKGLPQR